MALVQRRSAIIGTVCLLLTILPSWCTAAHAQEGPLAATAPVAAAEKNLPAVTAIGIVTGKTGTQITISGDADLTYEYFVIEGKSLVIDVPNATNKVWPTEQQVDNEFVGRLRVAEQTGGKQGVRIVFDLKKPDGFTVSGVGRRITVSFVGPQVAVASATVPAKAAAPGATNRIFEITANPRGSDVRIVVKSDLQPNFRVLPAGDPNQVRIAIAAARLDPAAAKVIEYTAPDAVVTKVAASTEQGEGNTVVVKIDLRQPAPFTVEPNSSGLFIDVSSARPRDVQAQRPATPPPTPAVPAAALFSSATPTGPQYVGGRITLDFIDADLLDIFRLIADVAGTNIVIEDGIKGRRSVNIRDIPWDQALDLILKTNNPPLARVDETPGVIRITTQKRILDDESLLAQLEIKRLELTTRQQEMERKTADTTRQLAQQEAALNAEAQRRKTALETFTFNVSYGDTKKIADRLKVYASSATDCGYCIFEVDERSNRIRVRDLAENIDSMLDVFSALDEPTSAVMVEARIVEVLSDFTQNLGIQWGANYIADAAHGNATGFAFPNSIGIGGTAEQGTGGINPGTYLVNLPASGQVGGIGLSLGHIANTFSLDIKLSALEKLGKTKILSNPKVLVVQNEEAKINVGSQLPIPKTDSTGGRTVEWKDVGILLQVKPQVTNDGTVFMKIQIEKSARGETVQTTEGSMFSIERRGADTKVLVGDGETTVIGGIFIQTEADGQSGIPGLEKIPLLGWLFKAKEKTENRTELMIFLTPHIVKSETRPVVEQGRKSTLVPLYGPRNLGGVSGPASVSRNP